MTDKNDLQRGTVRVLQQEISETFYNFVLFVQILNFSSGKQKAFMTS